MVRLELIFNTINDIDKYFLSHENETISFVYKGVIGFVGIALIRKSAKDFGITNAVKTIFK